MSRSLYLVKWDLVAYCQRYKRKKIGYPLEDFFDSHFSQSDSDGSYCVSLEEDKRALKTLARRWPEIHKQIKAALDKEGGTASFAFG